MIHDAHFHVEDLKLLSFMQEHGISGIVNAASPSEFQQLMKWLKHNDNIQISAGIHPWEADKLAWEDMFPFMEQAPIIGEIGLDNVWCEVSILKQYAILERSLAYASQAHKPVILHLKGLEKEVLPLLHKYKNQYLIHWYSCTDYLESFIDLDCYFSIGPSVNRDSAVQQVARQVPLKRLLIESDGLSALSWCEQKEITLSQYLDIMNRSIACIKALRAQAGIEEQLSENLQRFLSIL